MYVNGERNNLGIPVKWTRSYVSRIVGIYQEILDLMRLVFVTRRVRVVDVIIMDRFYGNLQTRIEYNEELITRNVITKVVTTVNCRCDI